MKFPMLQKEIKLISQGIKCIAGIDEAGRGAWAGPLVAAAITVSPHNLHLLKKIKPIRDSKLLSSLQRKKAYHLLIKNFSWSYGIVDSFSIDKLGLAWANQEAMNRAILGLELPPEFILADGRGFHFSLPCENVIDGDMKIKCISAASILAKVTRDALMEEYDKKFPEFHFARHKGYGTKLHQRMLKKYGICAIHRRSFEPIQKFVERAGF